MICIAPSMSLAFRSFIFVSAISRNWATVTVPAVALPGVFEPERGPGGELLWPAEVVLQLGAPAGTLTGRVVDADGEPMSGVKVWLDDSTSFGRSSDGLVAVETLLGGGEGFWNFVRTAADGTFELDGLLERDYRLQAVDSRTLVSVESGPVSAVDSPVELRLPTRDVHERVAGRVVTSSGAAIPGVSVGLFRITYEVHHEDEMDNEVEESEPVIGARIGLTLPLFQRQTGAITTASGRIAELQAALAARRASESWLTAD